MADSHPSKGKITNACKLVSCPIQQRKHGSKQELRIINKLDLWKCILSYRVLNISNGKVSAPAEWVIVNLSKWDQHT